MEPYTNIFNYYETYGYFAPQTRWLKHHTVEVKLMDFRNFESEVRTLFSKLDIPADTPIPKLNSGAKKLKPSDLTPEEIKFIKDLYKDDYEFFASKGITFPI